jgi:nitrous oxidase accessory protein
MKKLCILIGLLACIPAVFAKQIVVCQTCEVSTVKEAIAMAEDGDEVRVQKGWYRENSIVIDKSISLIGEEGAVIDGEQAAGILIFETDHFTIKGLKIINVGVSYTVDHAAIKVVRAKDFTIEDCVLENVFFGILIEKSARGRIRRNNISGQGTTEAGSGNGVHIWHSTGMEVSANELFHMRDGIYFEFVDDSEVFHNLSYQNLRYGLHFMFSNRDIYHHNEFRNNGSGVAVMFSKYISMYENKFMNNWGAASYGLLLKEIYDAEIYRNVFSKNTVAIKGEGCTRIQYTHNTFLRNGWAIKIAGACYTNIFEKNDFMHNSLDLSYDSKVNDNRFNNNYWSEYSGYDLDKDGLGDVPYRPVKLFSYLVNKTPESLVLLRSLFVDILNFSEKVSPVFTPDNLMDKNPLMQRIND